MRRLLLVALALVWLAATGVAFESGRRTEREYRAAVERLREDASLDVAIRRYDRGVFASEAVTTIEPRPEPGDAAAGPAPRLVLHHRIDHGPYPLAWLRAEAFDGRPILMHATTTPTVELETAEAIEEIALPVVVEARFGPERRATLRMVPDPEGLGAKDPELSADWAGVHAELGFDYDGASLAGALEIPRLVFDGEEAVFRLLGFRYAFDYQRVLETGPVYVGHGRLRVGEIAVEGEGGAFSLHDLEIEDASDAAGGVWSLQVDAGLGQLRGGERVWRDGELVVRVDGLALEPLGELGGLAESLQAAEGDEAAMKAELMGAAGALWPRLMAPGPSLEIPRLRLGTPDGEVRMAFRLGVDTSEPAFLVHPLMTLPALELDAELALPETLLHGWLATPRPVVDAGEPAVVWAAPAELAAQRVETWLDRGFLERDEGRYLLSVRVRQGTVRLNGRVVSFDAL